MLVIYLDKKDKYVQTHVYHQNEMVLVMMVCKTQQVNGVNLVPTARIVDLEN